MLASGASESAEARLWAKLLEKAFGSQFEDTDEMFVEHTEA